MTPHPLAPLVALAGRHDPASPLLAGRLTATYPKAFNEQLLREEIVNYPNQGGCPAGVLHGWARGSACPSIGRAHILARVRPVLPARWHPVACCARRACR